jgi:hypothetical protein
MGLAEWASIATIAAVPITAIGIWFTGRGAVNARQRELRDRLRKQLRGMEQGCDAYFQRAGWQQIERMPQYSPQKLKEIQVDGLLSPNRAHIAGLKALLHEVSGRSRMNPPLAALGREEYDRLVAVNQARLRQAFESLDTGVQQYLRALGKMDRGGFIGYWTYIVYRFIPPRKGLLARLIRA